MEQKGSFGELFSTFFRIGLCTFGGGYAMIPLISGICVEEKGWITSDEMMDVTVVAESTPGPMAINCATYVGWKMGGMAGAVAGTLGIVTPAFVIIYLISLFFGDILQVSLFFNAFRGIQAAVAILILDAAFSMLWRMEKRALSIGIFFGSALLMLLATLRSIHLSTITVLLAAAAVSLGVYGARGIMGDEEGKAPNPEKDKKKSGGTKKSGAGKKSGEASEAKGGKGSKKEAKAAKKDAKKGAKAAKKDAKAAKKAEKAAKKKGGKGK